ncbi:hypothetical protein [Micromonospora echinospora]|uniref:hypothetical protein n=1 Tax=Micromonospora echinospora TaxID=1877 RepID=UPI003A84AC72
MVLVVFLTACSDSTEPATAPSSSGEDDRWACRELQADLLDLPNAASDNAAIGGAAAKSTNADTRAAGQALVAAVQQAAGTEPGSVASAEADLAIAKARQALVEACISQFGSGPW